MTNRRTVLRTMTAALALAAARPVFAQATGSLDAVKARGVLRIGVTAADPWYYKNPTTQEWTGVGIILGKAMAEELGVGFDTVETTWGNSVAAIQAGQIDLMFVLDATEARKEAIDFPSNPLFYYAMGALVQNGMEVEAWEDLNKTGTRIGVTLGTTVDRLLTEKLPNATIERFANNDESVAAFVSRRVDVVSQFHPALIVQVSRIGTGKVVLPEEIYAVPTSVGLAKSEDGAFRDWVDEFIGRSYADGTTGRIFEEYIATKGIDPATVPGLVRERWL